LCALAQIHTASESLRIAERSYMMSPLRERWTPARAREMFADLADTARLHARIAPALPFVERALREVAELEPLASQEPVTLVHYDVYPPNVAFTRNAEKPEAVIIDWAAATADIAEIDLAFLFQQPYKSDRLLGWRESLQFYWDERERLTGKPYDWARRRSIFRYARIQALMTTMIAIHRAWERTTREDMRIAPDSPDPYMRFYDAALTDVLDTLQELAEDGSGND
jgi:thiamine kinase-like enzyme